ncbi:MAG TPA: hypothetical protein DD723_09235 [Candidatus Omnitrophica bacterium]|nr:hypothetical protein [Candidatus Omnitrophota bacterium]
MSSQKLSSWIEAVCREPYRLFFPLGAVMGIMGVSPWFFYALGWLKTYPGLFHASFQIMTYMTGFITGFLLTAMPRLLDTDHATKFELSVFLFLIMAMAGFLSFDSRIAAEVCFLLWLGWLILFGFRRILKNEKGPKGATPPNEFIWIPVAVGHGAIGTSLLMSGQLNLLPAWALLVGKPMMEQGFLLSIVLGVGGFLIPKLTGRKQAPISENQEKECGGLETKHDFIKRMTGILYALGGLVFFCSYWTQGGLGLAAPSRWIRVVVIFGMFLFTKALWPPRGKPLHIKMLWISVWSVALGYLGVALFPQQYLAMEHLAFIGGFGLMTYCVGTVVVVTHAGQAQRLQSSLGILWVVGIGTALSLTARFSAIVWPRFHYHFLGLSAFIGAVVAVCWLIFIWPLLFKVPSEADSAREHEQARKKMS